MGGTLLKTKVRINGVTPSLNYEFRWATPPGPVTEPVPSLEDAHTRHVKIKDTYAEGEISMKAYINDYSSDPTMIMDMLGLLPLYSYYDTGTDVVIHSTAHYDYLYEATGMLGLPKVPIELRQTHRSDEYPLDSNADNGRELGFKFMAAGEELLLLVFKAWEAIDGDVAGFNMEVHADNAGEPAAGKLAGSNTINVVCAGAAEPGDGDGNQAWCTIDFETQDVLGTATLTVGTLYWLVFIATDADPLNISYSSYDYYTSSDIKEKDNGGTWNAITGAVNPLMIVQFWQEKGGHTVEVTSYNDDESLYVRRTCRACDLRLNTQMIESGKAMAIKLTFDSRLVESAVDSS